MTSEVSGRGMRDAVVIFDFKGKSEKELSLREGDMLEVIQQNPSGWWSGRLGDAIGWFPGECVELIHSNSGMVNEDVLPEMDEEGGDGILPVLKPLLVKHSQVHVILSPPRCSSTCLARLLWEHPSVGWYSHEPFERCHYQDATLEDAAAQLLDPTLDLSTLESFNGNGDSLVVKEMTYQIGDHFNVLCNLSKGPIVFLIRDPRLSIASRIAKKVEGGESPFFNLWDSGWEGLKQLVEHCKENNKSYVIIDASEFRSQPESVLPQLFIKMGLGVFKSEYLKWSPQPSVVLDNLGGRHSHLYTRVLSSSGIDPPNEVVPSIDSFPEEKGMRDHVKFCLEIYKEMMEDPCKIKPEKVTRRPRAMSDKAIKLMGVKNAEQLENECLVTNSPTLERVERSGNRRRSSLRESFRSKRGSVFGLSGALQRAKTAFKARRGSDAVEPEGMNVDAGDADKGKHEGPMKKLTFAVPESPDEPPAEVLSDRSILSDCSTVDEDSSSMTSESTGRSSPSGRRRKRSNSGVKASLRTRRLSTGGSDPALAVLSSKNDAPPASPTSPNSRTLRRQLSEKRVRQGRAGSFLGRNKNDSKDGAPDNRPGSPVSIGKKRSNSSLTRSAGSMKEFPVMSPPDGRSRRSSLGGSQTIVARPEETIEEKQINDEKEMMKEIDWKALEEGQLIIPSEKVTKCVTVLQKLIDDSERKKLAVLQKSGRIKNDGESRMRSGVLGTSSSVTVLNTCTLFGSSISILMASLSNGEMDEFQKWTKVLQTRAQEMYFLLKDANSSTSQMYVRFISSMQELLEHVVMYMNVMQDDARRRIACQEMSTRFQALAGCGYFVKSFLLKLQCDPVHENVMRSLAVYLRWLGSSLAIKVYNIFGASAVFDACDELAFRLREMSILVLTLSPMSIIPHVSQLFKTHLKKILQQVDAVSTALKNDKKCIISVQNILFILRLFESNIPLAVSQAKSNIAINAANCVAMYETCKKLLYLIQVPFPSEQQIEATNRLLEELDLQNKMIKNWLLHKESTCVSDYTHHTAAQRGIIAAAMYVVKSGEAVEDNKDTVLVGTIRLRSLIEDYMLKYTVDAADQIELVGSLITKSFERYRYRRLLSACIVYSVLISMNIAKLEEGSGRRRLYKSCQRVLRGAVGLVQVLDYMEGSEWGMLSPAMQIVQYDTIWGDAADAFFAHAENMVESVEHGDLNIFTYEFGLVKEYYDDVRALNEMDDVVPSTIAPQPPVAATAVRGRDEESEASIENSSDDQ